MTEKPTTLSALKSALDNAVAAKVAAQTALEATPAAKRLAEISEEVDMLVAELKEYAKEKGDFDTRFMQFRTYDSKRLDHKGLVDKLIADKKVKPEYIARFIVVTQVTSASPIKNALPTE